jgi:hypothetical protein
VALVGTEHIDPRGFGREQEEAKTSIRRKRIHTIHYYILDRRRQDIHASMGQGPDPPPVFPEPVTSAVLIFSIEGIVTG